MKYSIKKYKHLINGTNIKNNLKFNNYDLTTYKIYPINNNLSLYFIKSNGKSRCYTLYTIKNGFINQYKTYYENNSDPLSELEQDFNKLVAFHSENKEENIMENFEKPKTKHMRKKCADIMKYLMAHDRVTKRELMIKFHINNERSVRDCIERLSKLGIAIISTSDTRGYKLAKTENDIPEVNHSICEDISRIKHLEQRIRTKEAYINFYKKHSSIEECYNNFINELEKGDVANELQEGC